MAIANTIGLNCDDAIQLGSLESGYAYCHKEGMSLPAPVKIAGNYTSDDGEIQNLDVFVSDEELYNCNSNRFEKINLSIIRSTFGGDVTLKRKALSFINTLMVESEENCITACNRVMDYLKTAVKSNGITLTFTHDSAPLISGYLTEIVLTLMVRGVYCSTELPNDEFVSLLKQTLYAPSREKILQIKSFLRTLYVRDVSKYAKINVAALIKRSLKNNTDISGSICEYFISVSDSTISEIEKMVKGGQLS